MNFICKCCLLFILEFYYKNYKSLFAEQFTVQRINEVSFFEVTSSRSCEDINGFHNVMKGNNILLSVLVRFLVSTFESFLGFREYFPPFVGHYLSGRGNLK